MTDARVANYERWFERMTKLHDFDRVEVQRWSCSFNGQNREDLERLRLPLTMRGFDVAEPLLSLTGKVYLMNADRVQVHSPESLAALADELDAFADEYGVVFTGFGRADVD